MAPEPLTPRRTTYTGGTPTAGYAEPSYAARTPQGMKPEEDFSSSTWMQDWWETRGKANRARYLARNPSQADTGRSRLGAGTSQWQQYQIRRAAELDAEFDRRNTLVSINHPVVKDLVAQAKAAGVQLEPGDVANLARVGELERAKNVIMDRIKNGDNRGVGNVMMSMRQRDPKLAALLSPMIEDAVATWVKEQAEDPGIVEKAIAWVGTSEYSPVAKGLEGLMWVNEQVRHVGAAATYDDRGPGFALGNAMTLNPGTIAGRAIANWGATARGSMSEQRLDELRRQYPSQVVDAAVDITMALADGDDAVFARMLSDETADPQVVNFIRDVLYNGPQTGGFDAGDLQEQIEGARLDNIGDIVSTSLAAIVKERTGSDYMYSSSWRGAMSQVGNLAWELGADPLNYVGVPIRAVTATRYAIAKLAPTGEFGEAARVPIEKALRSRTVAGMETNRSRRYFQGILDQLDRIDELTPGSIEASSAWQRLVRQHREIPEDILLDMAKSTNIQKVNGKRTMDGAWIGEGASGTRKADGFIDYIVNQNEQWQASVGKASDKAAKAGESFLIEQAVKAKLIDELEPDDLVALAAGKRPQNLSITTDEILAQARLKLPQETLAQAEEVVQGAIRRYGANDPYLASRFKQYNKRDQVIPYTGVLGDVRRRAVNSIIAERIGASRTKAIVDEFIGEDLSPEATAKALDTALGADMAGADRSVRGRPGKTQALSDRVSGLLSSMPNGRFINIKTGENSEEVYRFARMFYTRKTAEFLADKFRQGDEGTRRLILAGLIRSAAASKGVNLSAEDVWARIGDLATGSRRNEMFAIPLPGTPSGDMMKATLDQAISAGREAKKQGKRVKRMNVELEKLQSQLDGAINAGDEKSVKSLTRQVRRMGSKLNKQEGRAARAQADVDKYKRRLITALGRVDETRPSAVQQRIPAAMAEDIEQRLAANADEGITLPPLPNEAMDEVERMLAAQGIPQERFPDAGGERIIPTPAEMDAGLPGAPVAPIPDAGRSTTVKLPEDLRGAKPKYRDKNVSFASDLDRALFIVRDEAKRSKRDEDYMRFLRKQLPDLDDAGIRRRGNVVATRIKNLYDEAGGTVNVDRLYSPGEGATGTPAQRRAAQATLADDGSLVDETIDPTGRAQVEAPGAQTAQQVAFDAEGMTPPPTRMVGADMQELSFGDDAIASPVLPDVYPSFDGEQQAVTEIVGGYRMVLTRDAGGNYQAYAYAKGKKLTPGGYSLSKRWDADGDLHGTGSQIEDATKSKSATSMLENWLDQKISELGLALDRPWAGKTPARDAYLARAKAEADALPLGEKVAKDIRDQLTIERERRLSVLSEEHPHLIHYNESGGLQGDPIRDAERAAQEAANKPVNVLVDSRGLIYNVGLDTEHPLFDEFARAYASAYRTDLMPDLNNGDRLIDRQIADGVVYRGMEGGQARLEIDDSIIGENEAWDVFDLQMERLRSGDLDIEDLAFAPEAAAMDPVAETLQGLPSFDEYLEAHPEFDRFSTLMEGLGERFDDVMARELADLEDDISAEWATMLLKDPDVKAAYLDSQTMPVITEAQPVPESWAKKYGDEYDAQAGEKQAMAGMGQVETGGAQTNTVREDLGLGMNFHNHGGITRRELVDLIEELGEEEVWAWWNTGSLEAHLNEGFFNQFGPSPKLLPDPGKGLPAVRKASRVPGEYIQAEFNIGRSKTKFLRVPWKGTRDERADYIRTRYFDEQEQAVEEAMQGADRPGIQRYVDSVLAERTAARQQDTLLDEVDEERAARIAERDARMAKYDEESRAEALEPWWQEVAAQQGFITETPADAPVQAFAPLPPKGGTKEERKAAEELLSREMSLSYFLPIDSKTPIMQASGDANAEALAKYHAGEMGWSEQQEWARERARELYLEYRELAPIPQPREYWDEIGIMDYQARFARGDQKGGEYVVVKPSDRRLGETAAAAEPADQAEMAAAREWAQEQGRSSRERYDELFPDGILAGRLSAAERPDVVADDIVKVRQVVKHQIERVVDGEMEGYPIWAAHVELKDGGGVNVSWREDGTLHGGKMADYNFTPEGFARLVEEVTAAAQAKKMPLPKMDYARDGRGMDENILRAYRDEMSAPAATPTETAPTLDVPVDVPTPVPASEDVIEGTVLNRVDEPVPAAAAPPAPPANPPGEPPVGPGMEGAGVPEPTPRLPKTGELAQWLAKHQGNGNNLPTQVIDGETFLTPSRDEFGREHAVHMYQTSDFVVIPHMDEIEAFGRVRNAAPWLHQGMQTSTDIWSLATLYGFRFAMRSSVEDLMTFTLTGGLGHLADLQRGRRGSTAIREANPDIVVEPEKIGGKVTGEEKIVTPRTDQWWALGRHRPRTSRLGMVARTSRHVSDMLHRGNLESTQAFWLGNLPQESVVRAAAEMQAGRYGAMQGLIAEAVGRMHYGPVGMSEGDVRALQLLGGTHAGRMLLEQMAEAGAQINSGTYKAIDDAIQATADNPDLTAVGFKRPVQFGDFKRLALAANKQSDPFADWYWHRSLQAIVRDDGPIGHIFVKLMHNPDAAKKAIADAIRKDTRIGYRERFSLITSDAAVDDFAHRYYEASLPYFQKADGTINETLRSSFITTWVDPKSGKSRMRVNWYQTDKRGREYMRVHPKALTRMPREDKPMYVLGREEKVVTAKNEKALMDRPWEWMGNQYARVAREPIFIGNYMANMRALKPMQDNLAQAMANGRTGKVGAKVTDADTAAAEAIVARQSQDAAYAFSLNYMDNPGNRSVLAWKVRNVARYYRATEDFARRATRLAKNYPDAYYKLAITYQVLEDTGFTYRDDNGDMYFAYPANSMLQDAFSAVGHLFNGVGSPIAADPFMVGGFVKNIAPSTDPEQWAPTFTGVITLPLTGLFNAFPSLQGLRTATLGGYSTAGQTGSLAGELVDAIMPAGVRRIWTQLEPGEREAALANAGAGAVASLIADGSLDNVYNTENPLTLEQLKDNDVFAEAQKRAVGIALTKVWLGYTAPASPQVFQNNVTLFARESGIESIDSLWHDMIEANDGDMTAAYLDWERLDPDGKLLPFTVSKTKSNPDRLMGLTGAQPYKEVIDWMRSDGTKDIASRFPDSYMFLAPREGTFDWAAWALIKADGFRVDKTEDEMLIDLFAANGRSLDNEVVQGYDMEIAKYSRDTEDGRQQIATLEKAKAADREQIKNMNPYWATQSQTLLEPFDVESIRQQFVQTQNMLDYMSEGGTKPLTGTAANIQAAMDSYLQVNVAKASISAYTDAGKAQRDQYDLELAEIFNTISASDPAAANFIKTILSSKSLFGRLS